MRILTYICNSPLYPSGCYYDAWYPVFVLVAIAAAGLAGYVIGRGVWEDMNRGRRK